MGYWRKGQLVQRRQHNLRHLRCSQRSGCCKGRSCEEICVQRIRLDSCFESQKCVSRIGHLKDASKPVLRQVSNLQDLQLRGNGSKVEFRYDNIVDDDGRFRRLIERSR